MKELRIVDTPQRKSLVIWCRRCHAKMLEIRTKEKTKGNLEMVSETGAVVTVKCSKCGFEEKIIADKDAQMEW